MTVLEAFHLLVQLAYREKFNVSEASAHYLEDYADAQIAKGRFNDPNSRIITGIELRKRLGV